MLAFIDETGDHNLLKIDPQYPLFMLGALIIQEEVYEDMQEIVAELKCRHFGDDGSFILHSSELKRPYDTRSDQRNAVMANADVRKRFYSEFDERVVKALPFGIAACSVRKPELLSTYHYPVDPYHFAFENLLNRVIRYGNATTAFYAEARGPELDIELVTEYERLTQMGSKFYSGDELKKRTNLTLVKKAENCCGLQVIDLVLASLARAELDKEYKMIGNDLDPATIRRKLVCPMTRFPAKA